MPKSLKQEIIYGIMMVFAMVYAMVCYNVTLNVWECNPTAKKFYEKCGLSVLKTGMEQIL